MAQLFVCWGISILLLVVCIVFGIMRKSGKSLVIAGTAGVGSAVFVLRFMEFFPPLQGGLAEKISSIFLTAGKALVHMLQTFSLDEEYDILLDKILSTYTSTGVPGTVLNIFTVYYTFLNVLAPIMTLAFILTLLEELISHMRAVRPFRETFIFSELNERSLTLAEDIRKHKRHALLLFTDAYVKADDEQKSELRERARQIEAICIKDDITTMRIHHHSSVPITFVLADMNEYENLRVAAWLSRGNKKLDRLNYANVLVFCPRNEADTTVQATIDNRSNKNMRFIAVNDSIYPIHQLLTEHPLFARMEESTDQNARKKCTVLIVGCGYIGMECVKAIAWCGQLTNTDLKIRVISNDAEEKFSGFRKTCPELFSTGIYDIEFKSLDVWGAKFLEHLQTEVPDACYVVVALGEDQRNISISTDLERLYNRIHLTGGKAPQICYMVMDDNLYSTFDHSHESVKQPEEENVEENEEARKKKEEAKREEEKKCLLIPFGSNKERFSMKSIFSSDLERMALSVHLTYWNRTIEVPKDLIARAKKSFLQGCRFDKVSKVKAEADKKKEEEEKTLSRRYILCLFNRCFPHKRWLMRLYCAVVSFLRGGPAAEKELRKELSAREVAINTYYESIYGQDSSRASAIHMRYKLYVAGLPAIGPISEKSLEQYKKFIEDDANCLKISKLEHLRWDAYMRSIGYVKPTDDEFDIYAYRNGNNQQNKKLRLHPCLVDWDERLGKVLTEEDRVLFENDDQEFMNGRFKKELDELDRVSLKVWLSRKERKKEDRFEDYKVTDEKIIKKVPEILGNAKEAEELI